MKGRDISIKNTKAQKYRPFRAWKGCWLNTQGDAGLSPCSPLGRRALRISDSGARELFMAVCNRVAPQKTPSPCENVRRHLAGGSIQAIIKSLD